MTRGPEVWRDLQLKIDSVEPERRPNAPPTRRNPSRPSRLRLRGAQLDQIADRWSHGEPAAAIAADVGLDPADIRRIWRERQEIGERAVATDMRPRARPRKRSP